MPVLLLLFAALLLSCGPSDDGARPNFILVVIDALRADNLACYGYDRATSPVIDTIAEDGILFETAITAAPWTKASFSSFLTSTYPFQHGVNDWTAVMPESIVTLPELLVQQDYSTVCLMNMIGLGERFEVLKGFQSVSQAAKAGRDARETTDDAIEYLRDLPEPFFMLLHYFDVHQPYAPPVKYVDLVKRDSDPDPLSGRRRRRRDESEQPTRQAIDHTKLLYDGCIRYVDESLGRVFALLDERGIRDNTVIIITADHGEAFWEHGVDSHGANVYDEGLKVPLIIAWPEKFPGGRRIASQARLVDILPTVVDITGAPDPGKREGVSLLPILEGKQPEDEGMLLPAYIAYAENGLIKTPQSKCLRTLDWKVIVEPATALVEIYDLEQDPSEAHNLFGEDICEASSLLDVMESLPGTSWGGWRFGLTGKSEGHDFRVRLDVLDGGTISGVEQLTRRQSMRYTLDESRKWLEIEGKPAVLHMLLFTVDPPDARVVLRLVYDGPGGLNEVYTGGTGSVKIADDGIVLSRKDVTGLPSSFQMHRESRALAAHVWWLPGGATQSRPARAALTEEETRSLRALGYIQ